LPAQDRHAEAFSCPTPIMTTLPWPPAAAASRYGRAISSRSSPLAKRITGMAFFLAKFLIAVSYALPTSPKALEDG
jgi:hypothetical protein